LWGICKASMNPAGVIYFISIPFESKLSTGFR
jgi:hypothetical protein